VGSGECERHDEENKRANGDFESDGHGFVLKMRCSARATALGSQIGQT
jgi:hypothetical protein